MDCKLWRIKRDKGGCGEMDSGSSPEHRHVVTVTVTVMSQSSLIVLCN